MNIQELQLKIDSLSHDSYIMILSKEMYNIINNQLNEMYLDGTYLTFREFKSLSGKNIKFIPVNELHGNEYYLYSEYLKLDDKNIIN